MTSKEALKDILSILMNFEHIYAIDDTYEVKKQRSEIIEKDLDLLEEYRKIEKELGIDLKVYHKLMNMLYCGEPNILYIKDKDKIVQVGILEIDYCKKKIIFYKDKSYNEDYVYGFIQYGKNWSLDKGDLEND